MFSYKLSENTEVRLLEERHAQQLTDLTDRNREHLREWLPWVDTNRTVEDRKNFIRALSSSSRRTRDLCPASGTKVAWQGLLATIPSTWRIAPLR